MASVVPNRRPERPEDADSMVHLTRVVESLGQAAQYRNGMTFFGSRTRGRSLQNVDG